MFTLHFLVLKYLNNKFGTHDNCLRIQLSYSAYRTCRQVSQESEIHSEVSPGTSADCETAAFIARCKWHGKIEMCLDGEILFNTFIDMVWFSLKVLHCVQFSFCKPHYLCEHAMCKLSLYGVIQNQVFNISSIVKRHISLHEIFVCNFEMRLLPSAWTEGVLVWIVFNGMQLSLWPGCALSLVVLIYSMRWLRMCGQRFQ